MKITTLKKYLLPTLLVAASSVAIADDAEIVPKQLTESIHVLAGPAGNVAVLTGEDGLFMVDDKLKETTKALEAAIKTLNAGQPRFLINTHWHYDHVGANTTFGEHGAVIVAHKNVRKRMSKDQIIEVFNREVPATPDIGLPIVTFTQDISFHLNGQKVDVIHQPNAHTDGDSVIFFSPSNVVHMGDIYFAGMFPFIDVQSGGSIAGVISAVKNVLGRIDEKTKVIPGHGPVTDKKGLSAYKVMLMDVEATLKKLAAEKKSVEAVIKLDPLKKYDANWGKGFLPTAKFTEIVYRSMVE